jgi:hypothetical protein
MRLRGTRVGLWDDPRIVRDRHHASCCAAKRRTDGVGVVPARWVAAACVVAALAAGCGAGATSTTRVVSPERVVAEAIAAAQTVRSYRVQETGTDRSGRFWLTAEVDGPDRILAIERRAAGTVRLVKVGPFAYLDAPRAYWAGLPNMTPTEVAAISGRWLKLPGSAKFESAAARVGTLRKLAQCWGTTSRAGLSYVGRGDLDGHPVVILANSGGAPGTAPGKAYVSTAPPKLPLRVVITGPQKPGAPAECQSIVTSGIETLSDFNQRFDISAPAHALSFAVGGALIEDRNPGAALATRST